MQKMNCYDILQQILAFFCGKIVELMEIKFLCNILRKHYVNPFQFSGWKIYLNFCFIIPNWNENSESEISKNKYIFMTKSLLGRIE